MYCRYRGCLHSHGYTQKSSLQSHLDAHTDAVLPDEANQNSPTLVIALDLVGNQLLPVEDSPFVVHSPSNLLICIACGEGIELKNEDTENPGLSHLTSHHTRSGISTLMPLLVERLGERRIYTFGFQFNLLTRVKVQQSGILSIKVVFMTPFQAWP